MKRIIKFLTVVLFFGFQFVSAQSVGDIATVNVDDLSDERIKEVWESAKSKGYGIGQVEMMLRSKGMPQQEIDKLKVRINSLNVKGGSVPTKEVLNAVVAKNDTEAFGLTGKETKIKKSVLYGYDFFNNPNISFTPNVNVATPENYQLGAGDVLQIDIWGASEATYQKEINKQGNIQLQGVGTINLNGLKFDVATSKIKSYLKRIYSGIGAPKSSYNKVYVGVTLAKVRTVQVNLVGNVKIPGTYSLSGLSNVLTALYSAGGPTKDGNFRKISLVRYGKKIAEFDFYQYLQNGSEKGNLSLQDQDVIIVSPYENLVKIEGAVKREGFYQMKEGENMSELFKYCGGFTANAYRNSIVIERIKGKNREIVEFDFNKASFEKTKNGDVISVKEIADKYENGVTISGAVYIPGKYEFKEGMTVADLLKKASGLKKDAFLGRALITRYKNEVDKQIISFSLEESGNVKLKTGDSITIYGKNDLRQKQTVTINGAVNKPKTIEFAEGITVEDMIVLAGGLKEGADLQNIEVSRRKNDGSFETLGEVFKLTSSKELKSGNGEVFELKPYDIVSVRYLKGYSVQKSVAVSGEVKVPGSYVVTVKNERISDLLERAGGVTSYAYLGGATLVRNGTRVGIDLEKILKDKKGFSDLFLEEGDRLVIPSIKQTVEVRGAVYAPSLVQYVPGKGLKYYINNSGGFTTQAKKSKTYVAYTGGEVAATKRFLFVKNYPKIKPGAVIFVPKKDENRRRVSAQEVIGIATGIATLGILIDRLVDKK